MSDPAHSAIDVSTVPPSSGQSVIPSAATSNLDLKNLSALLLRLHAPRWAVRLTGRKVGNAFESREDAFNADYHQDRTMQEAKLRDILGVEYMLSNLRSTKGKPWESPWQAMSDGTPTQTTVKNLQLLHYRFKQLQTEEDLRLTKRLTDTDRLLSGQVASASEGEQRAKAVETQWQGSSWAARRLMSLNAGDKVLQSLCDSAAATAV